jgi:phosphatidyl-myo-inositol alpha-mannosyltransferase
MRIVQVCPYSWDAPGGVQVHVRQLARHLAGRGHEVMVLTPGENPPDDAHVRLVGRPLRIRFNGSVVPLCYTRRSAHVVRQALEQFAPDLVHVHDPLSPSTSRFAAKFSQAPIVATFHSYFGHIGAHAKIYDLAVPLLRPIWRRITRRVAVSEAAASCVSSRMAEGGDHVYIVPNGADIAPLETACPADLPPGRKMLFVGRLHRRKGFAVAVRAFAELAPKIPDLLLIVAGDGDERNAVDALAPDVRRRVHMLGAVPHEQVPSYFRASDLYIGPATGQESFGIVLVEAMAAGLPVVASDIPGYREVARPGRDGLLVPPGDATALANAVQRVLEQPALARRLSEAGRRRAVEFSWERVMARLETIYDEALEIGLEGEQVAKAVARPAWDTTS